MTTPEVNPETQHTPAAVCPHCGYAHMDSWEFNDSQRVDCHECSKPFQLERYTEVTYCTKPLDPPK